MARFPSLKLTGSILAAGGAQFGHEFGVLRRQPVLQFVERFYRGEDWSRDFNSVRFHAMNLHG